VSEGYSELRVPTKGVDVEVQSADGRTFRGKVFVPDVAVTHRGPMRAVEWMNEPAQFFAFVPEDGSASFLLNRSEIVVLTASAQADADLDDPEASGAIRRRVIVECRDRRYEGEIVIDMPAHLSRVSDYLNRADPFVIVSNGERHHLIRKERITRVLEPKER
jgi:hypothetical protein